MSKRLFAYGTLLPGHGPAHLLDTLARLTPIDNGTVQGALYDLGAYPGLVLVDSPDRVAGKVLAVPEIDSIWKLLDDYEGVDPTRPAAGLFRRESCLARINSGGVVECEVYVYNGRPPESRRIVSGRWKTTADDAAPRAKT